MPSKKILSVIVLSGATILATWLIASAPSQTSISSAQKGQVYSISRDEIKTNEDWKKILTNITEASSTVVNLTQNKGDDTFDETSLTGQMSRDFMSEYLLLKKGNKTLTQADINKIINDVSSAPQYSQTQAAVYIASNLHVIYQNDKATSEKYKQNINLILKTRSLQIKDNPVWILDYRAGQPQSVSASVNQSEDAVLGRLDAVTSVGQSIISDLLNVSVPSDAVSIHLSLLNAFSHLLSDVQSMRLITSDPVKAMVGLSQYTNDISNFNAILESLNSYFIKTTGSSL